MASKAFGGMVGEGVQGSELEAGTVEIVTLCFVSVCQGSAAELASFVQTCVGHVACAGPRGGQTRGGFIIGGGLLEVLPCLCPGSEESVAVAPILPNPLGGAFTGSDVAGLRLNVIVSSRCPTS